MRSSAGSLQRFKVTITETLKLTVDVEADNQQQAEQMISDGWYNSEYILNADNFVSVDFEAVVEMECEYILQRQSEAIAVAKG